MLTVDEIRTIVAPLVEPFPVFRVILFGSYARGEATERSDVDLVIDYDTELSYWEFLGLSGRIIEKMPTKVDVLGLNEIKKPKMLDDITNEGVIIYDRTN